MEFLQLLLHEIRFSILRLKNPKSIMTVFMAVLQKSNKVQIKKRLFRTTIKMQYRVCGSFRKNFHVSQIVLFNVLHIHMKEQNDMNEAREAKKKF